MGTQARGEGENGREFMSASSSKIVTFGCRLNALESEEMNRWVEKTQGIIVVNTCAVTAEAERQARQKIRQLKRQNPQVKIIVTGCSAALHA